MQRLTSKHTWEEIEDDLAAEYGYSHIWKRLNAIENILGDDYDLDRLRVLVEATNEERVEIKPAPYGNTCGQCAHFHQNTGARDGICDARRRWHVYDAKTLMESGPEKAKIYLDPFTTTRACDKFEPKIK